MTWGRSKLNTVFPLCPPEAKEPFCSDSPNKFGNSNDDESLFRLVAILNDLQKQNSLFLELHFNSLENDPRSVPYIRLIEPIVDKVLKLTAACCDAQTKNLIASLHVAKKCDGQMDLVKSYLQFTFIWKHWQHRNTRLLLWPERNFRTTSPDKSFISRSGWQHLMWHHRHRIN